MALCDSTPLRTFASRSAGGLPTAGQEVRLRRDDEAGRAIQDMAQQRRPGARHANEERKAGGTGTGIHRSGPVAELGEIGAAEAGEERQLPPPEMTAPTIDGAESIPAALPPPAKSRVEHDLLEHRRIERDAEERREALGGGHRVAHEILEAEAEVAVRVARG